MAIVVNSGIKVIPIENENGKKVASIVLNENDNNFMIKFKNTMKRMNEIKEKLENKLSQVQHGTDRKEEIERLSFMLEEEENSIKEIIHETEVLLGENLIHDIFADAYAVNKDFVPNITAISELYKQVIPYIKEVFNWQQESDYKYDVTRKGSINEKTKNRYEILKEYQNE